MHDADEPPLVNARAAAFIFVFVFMFSYLASCFLPADRLDALFVGALPAQSTPTSCSILTTVYVIN